MGLFEVITAVKRDRGITVLQLQYIFGYKLEICMVLLVTLLIGFILHTVERCQRSFEGTFTVGIWQFYVEDIHVAGVIVKQSHSGFSMRYLN